jgi:hypothetical protein
MMMSLDRVVVAERRRSDVSVYTAAGMRGVEGLPAYFQHYKRHLGSRTVRVRLGAPDTGEIVER